MFGKAATGNTAYIEQLGSWDARVNRDRRVDKCNCAFFSGRLGPSSRARAGRTWQGRKTGYSAGNRLYPLARPHHHSFGNPQAQLLPIEQLPPGSVEQEENQPEWIQLSWTQQQHQRLSQANNRCTAQEWDQQAWEYFVFEFRQSCLSLPDDARR